MIKSAQTLAILLGHASTQETAAVCGRWVPANRKGALDVLDDALTDRAAAVCNHFATERLEH